MIGGDADTDGDGVGDGCDPHPAVAGDQLASFEGFYDPVSWKAVIGADTWQVADGALQQTNTDGSYQLVSDGARHDVFVDAKLRINAIAAGTARRSAGLVLGYGDPNQYLFCLLATQVGGADLNAGEVYLDYYDSPQWGYNPATFDTQMVGDWVTLQARVRRITSTLTRITCTTRRGSAIATISYDSDASPSGAIGVRTNGVDASFDYIFVVETPEGSP